TGVVTRNEGPATIVSFDGIESILPRSEQIPGETHHPNERVRAVIFEVKPQGSRVKVVLSRTRPQLVQRLFEQEIPEIADGVITIQAIAREPGHRSKVAVSSSDQRVDCVGACVGVRGNRIKNIVDELAGERIDIVRYNEDAETLIRAALQPAEVDQVLLCDMIGRAIVLVREDQLSLAIGRKGQNVRLASKLCGWDIEIMTNEELEQQIERAVGGFMQIDGMNEELAQRLVEQGYLSYDDLSVIEPDALMEMGSMTEEQVNHIVEQADTLAQQAEKAADDERRRKKAEDAAAAAAAASGETVAATSTATPAATTSSEASAPAAPSESAETSAPPADTAS
ncbi:MAG: transcription termination factor NusA, partial [Planctomycetia bacterium]|nr:transcription termination factor NusA [Planctomycetia bacterium]